MLFLIFNKHFTVVLWQLIPSSMNVNHLTSTSATRKRIVPKHLTHISALVWMVILGMELTVKVKIDVLYQTRKTDSVHHISRQPDWEIWKYRNAKPSIFDRIQNVGNCDETLFRVFDRSCPSKLKLRSKQRIKTIHAD